MRALLPGLIAVSVLCTSGRALAEPWSTTPLIGVVGQYASNPVLTANDPQSEINGALVLTLPVNYDSDEFHVMVTPNIRYGNASGYSGITSNYYHLDGSAQFADGSSSTTLSASIDRDSSLLYAGELSNGVGVRRDTSVFGIDWQRPISERVQLELAGNTFRTLYDAPAAPDSAVNRTPNTLADYRYSAFSPTLAIAGSELDTLRLIGSAARYEALDGVSASNNANVQLGFDRRLSEIWTVKTTAGYSRAENRYNLFYGKYLLEQIDSTQNGTVYSANLVAQEELLTLNLGVSRALTPTGSAYLARQQSANILAHYVRSERWSYGVDASYQTNSYPNATGGAYRQRYYSAALSATLHLTEQWALTVQATKVLQRYGAPEVTGASSGASIMISRQFQRKDL